jgi:hypothetical protein
MSVEAAPVVAYMVWATITMLFSAAIVRRPLRVPDGNTSPSRQP